MSTYEHLTSLSDEFSDLVSNARRAVVMVAHEEGAPRSGFFFAKDTVVSVARQAEVGETVSVTLADGSTGRGTVKAFDATSGIGLLSVEGETAFEPADGAPALGSLTVTVAYPSSHGHESRLGMVRCTGGSTYLPGGRRIGSYLQTDSPAYRGFLGAPVLDVKGSLIGMSMGARDDWFILPVGELRTIVEDLAENPEIGMGYLGVRTEEAPLPTGDASAMLVVAVEEESPATQAGIRIGDMITSVGGVTTGSLQSLADALVGKNGATVDLALIRGGDTVDVSVQLGSHRWDRRRSHPHGQQPHGSHRPRRRPGGRMRG